MAGEMPGIDVAHAKTPATESELGAKGAGESGTGAATERDARPGLDPRHAYL